MQVSVHNPSFKSHEEVVRFDHQGNMVINRNHQQPRKLVARRVIEAHRERRCLERELDEYDFGGI